MPQPEIAVLLTLIDQAYDRRSWHGTNLRGSLRGLTPAAAAWRPAARRHNVWEVAVHAAYWKYVVRRRLRGERRGSFPLRGSNWFARPVEATDAAWRADLELLAECHRSLRAAVAALEPRDLRSQPRGSKVTTLDIVLGIAAHDLYHAGQIQLLKRLRRG